MRLDKEQTQPLLIQPGLAPCCPAARAHPDQWLASGTPACLLSTEKVLSQGSEKTLIELAVMIKDRLAQLIGIPGDRLMIRVEIVTATENFVAIS